MNGSNKERSWPSIMSEYGNHTLTFFRFNNHSFTYRWENLNGETLVCHIPSSELRPKVLYNKMTLAELDPSAVWINGELHLTEDKDRL